MIEGNVVVYEWEWRCQRSRANRKKTNPLRQRGRDRESKPAPSPTVSFANNGGARDPRGHAQGDWLPLFSPPASRRFQRPQPPIRHPENLCLPRLNQTHHLFAELPTEDLQVRQLQPFLLRRCLRLPRPLHAETASASYQFLQRSSLAHYQRLGLCQVHGRHVSKFHLLSIFLSWYLFH